MTKYYAIHAYETYFGGLHGVEDKCVISCETEEDAEAILNDMAWEVYCDFCDGEYDADDFEADGEWFFVGEDLSKKQLDMADEMAYNDFNGLRDMVAANEAPWQKE